MVSFDFSLLVFVFIHIGIAIAFISGPEKCQNFDADFNLFLNKDSRHFTLSHLNRTLANGSVVKRDWVVFSPALEAVLCFPCKLFGNESQQQQAFTKDGFKDWKNCGRSFKIHENSKNHIENCVSYRTRAKSINTIDASYHKHRQVEMKYWREVLLRVVSVIKFLASRGLPFRGSEEKFGASSNGNYFGVLELLAEYDPFLANHIENYGNKGKGISYFKFNECILHSFVCSAHYIGNNTRVVVYCRSCLIFVADGLR